MKVKTANIALNVADSYFNDMFNHRILPNSTVPDREIEFRLTF